MSVDTIDIEYAFSMLVGEGHGALNGLVDAEVFQRGNPEEIGRLLEKSIDIMAERLSNIPYADWEAREGKIRPRLQLAIAGLKEIAREMQRRHAPEPEDYHWGLVGYLVQVIANLLNRLEGKSRW